MARVLLSMGNLSETLILLDYPESSWKKSSSPWPGLWCWPQSWPWPAAFLWASS